ncbi:hypothetical protein [Polynucleobacter arcticus]|uniref:Uncharacterized protein n=1 Tax=Polynucleobacter arcticus TaxID=1743165 RepID=A0A6M9PP92_9BURK|nr:hypothetical protein [Polynucleobacter arcticus]QKM60715.1 hypothetical protein DN92_06535 [Polynucleobacter arcticus]
MTAKKSKGVKKQTSLKTKDLPNVGISQIVANHPCASDDITPLKLMLKIMHELYAEAERCAANADQSADLFGRADSNETRVKLLNMAASVGRHVAPYIHPRLSAIEHTGKDGAPLQSGVLVVPSAMSIDDWEQAAQAKH